MTTQGSPSSHSTPLNHSKETPMNLDTLARLETQAREAEIRHHLDERTLERAAERQNHRTATSGADGPGLLSRFIGGLAVPKSPSALPDRLSPQAPRTTSTSDTAAAPERT